MPTDDVTSVRDFEYEFRNSSLRFVWPRRLYIFVTVFKRVNFWRYLKMIYFSDEKGI